MKTKLDDWPKEELLTYTKKLESTLLKISKHDFQKLASEALRNPPSGVTQRMCVYEGVLKIVASADIQYWAKGALCAHD